MAVKKEGPGSDAQLPDHDHMAYVKPDKERGYIGAWMRRERLEKGWSVEEVVQKLKDEYGEETRVDYYRYLEAGPRKPGPVLLAALCRLFDSEPQPFDDEPTDGEVMAAAIDRLTEEVSDLKDALVKLLAEDRLCLPKVV